MITQNQFCRWYMFVNAGFRLLVMHFVFLLVIISNVSKLAECLNSCLQKRQAEREHNWSVILCEAQAQIKVDWTSPTSFQLCPCLQETVTDFEQNPGDTSWLCTVYPRAKAVVLADLLCVAESTTGKTEGNPQSRTPHQLRRRCLLGFPCHTFCPILRHFKIILYFGI